jgi:hypothetical protein
MGNPLSLSLRVDGRRGPLGGTTSFCLVSRIGRACTILLWFRCQVVAEPSGVHDSVLELEP